MVKRTIQIIIDTDEQTAQVENDYTEENGDEQDRLVFPELVEAFWEGFTEPLRDMPQYFGERWFPTFTKWNRAYDKWVAKNLRFRRG